MSLRGAVATAALAGCLPALAQHAAPEPIAASGTVQVAFAPWHDVEGLIVSAIAEARRQVLVQAFSFTSRRLAAALVEAKRRGVEVQVTADRSQTLSGEPTRIPDLAAAGIPVFLETRYAAAHNKVMVINGESRAPVVITGSFNWTGGAQRRNAENVLVLRRNREVARAYVENWRRHAAEAAPYTVAKRR